MGNGEDSRTIDFSSFTWLQIRKLRSKTCPGCPGLHLASVSINPVFARNFTAKTDKVVWNKARCKEANGKKKDHDDVVRGDQGLEGGEGHSWQRCGGETFWVGVRMMCGIAQRWW